MRNSPCFRRLLLLAGSSLLASGSVVSAQTISLNFEGETAGSTTVPTGWSYTSVVGATRTYTTSAVNGGTNNSGVGTGLGGVLVSDNGNGTAIPNTFLLNSGTAVGFDTSKAITGTYDFKHTHKDNYDASAFLFGDIKSGSLPKTDAGQLLLAFHSNGGYGNAPNRIVNGTDANLATQQADHADNTWYRVTFSWTPTSGTKGNFTWTSKTLSSGVTKASLTASGMTLTPAQAHLGFADLSATNTTFDNISVTGTAFAGAYWDTNGTTAGAGGTAPTGIWDGSNNWNPSADGTGTTAAWSPGGVAIFAAGNDATAPYTVTVSGTQDIGGLSFENGTPTLTGGTLRMVSDSYAFVKPGSTATIASAISDDGSARVLSKTGTGTLVLAQANTYTGATSVSEGMLNLGVAENAGVSGPLGNSAAANPGSIVLGGGTLQYSAANSNDYSGRFSTAASQQYNVDTNAQMVIWATALTSSGGTLTKSGLGSLTLSGPNTYTGLTTVSGGTLALSDSGTLGSGAGGLTMSGGSLNVGGFSRSVAAVSVTNAAASGDTISNGSLTGTSYAASNASGDAIISANLLVNGAAGFAKSGAGTVTLSGANTYTGATSVSAGTLQYNGSLTGAGAAVSVSSTGTLGVGASATIARNVNLSSGAVNLAGTVAGTLTVTGGTLTTSGSAPTVTTADFSVPGAGTVAASTPLVITNQLKLSGVTATLTGGTSFTAAGTNLANAATANTLTLSGGTLALSDIVPTSITLTNPSFETDAGSINTYQAIASISGWTDTLGTYIEQGSSRIFAPAANPNYNASTNFKWAALQGPGTLSQNITVATAGDYTLSFAYAGRPSGFGPLYIQAQVGSTDVTSVLAPSTSAWNTATSSAVYLTSGSHTLNFVFTNPLGGDKSSVLDNIALTGMVSSGGNMNLSATSVAATASSVLDLGASGGAHTLASLNLTAGSTTTALGLKNGASLTLNGDASNNAISATGSAGHTASILPDVTSPPSLIISAGQNVSVDPGVTLTIQSVISGGALNKIGDGTLTLSGNNTYTGVTTVSGGTLFINGNHTSGGLITVSSGATLGGTGTMGAVSIEDGFLAPGNTPGTLTVGDLTLDGTSALDFELGNPWQTLPVPLDSDYIAVGGALTLAGTLKVTHSAPPALGDKWLLMTYTGDRTGDIATITPTVANGLTYNILFEDKNVFLAVVPEPASAGLLLIGGLALRVLSRRRSLRRRAD